MKKFIAKYLRKLPPLLSSLTAKLSNLDQFSVDVFGDSIEQSVSPKKISGKRQLTLWFQFFLPVALSVRLLITSILAGAILIALTLPVAILEDLRALLKGKRPLAQSAIIKCLNTLDLGITLSRIGNTQYSLYSKHRVKLYAMLTAPWTAAKTIIPNDKFLLKRIGLTLLALINSLRPLFFYTYTAAMTAVTFPIGLALCLLQDTISWVMAKIMRVPMPQSKTKTMLLSWEIEQNVRSIRESAQNLWSKCIVLSGNPDDCNRMKKAATSYFCGTLPKKDADKYHMNNTIDAAKAYAMASLPQIIGGTAAVFGNIVGKAEVVLSPNNEDLTESIEHKNKTLIDKTVVAFVKRDLTVRSIAEQQGVKDPLVLDLVENTTDNAVFILSRLPPDLYSALPSAISTTTHYHQAWQKNYSRLLKSRRYQMLGGAAALGVASYISPYMLRLSTWLDLFAYTIPPILSFGWSIHTANTHLIVRDPSESHQDDLALGALCLQPALEHSICWIIAPYIATQCNIPGWGGTFMIASLIEAQLHPIDDMKDMNILSNYRNPLFMRFLANIVIAMRAFGMQSVQGSHRSQRANEYPWMAAVILSAIYAGSLYVSHYIGSAFKKRKKDCEHTSKKRHKSIFKKFIRSIQSIKGHTHLHDKVIGLLNLAWMRMSNPGDKPQNPLVEVINADIEAMQAYTGAALEVVCSRPAASAAVGLTVITLSITLAMQSTTAAGLSILTSGVSLAGSVAATASADLISMLPLVFVTALFAFSAFSFIWQKEFVQVFNSNSNNMFLLSAVAAFLPMFAPLFVEQISLSALTTPLFLVGYFTYQLQLPLFYKPRNLRKQSLAVLQQTDQNFLQDMAQVLTPMALSATIRSLTFSDKPPTIAQNQSPSASETVLKAIQNVRHISSRVDSMFR